VATPRVTLCQTCWKRSPSRGSPRRAHTMEDEELFPLALRISHATPQTPKIQPKTPNCTGQVQPDTDSHRFKRKSDPGGGGQREWRWVQERTRDGGPNMGEKGKVAFLFLTLGVLPLAPFWLVSSADMRAVLHLRALPRGALCLQ